MINIEGITIGDLLIAGASLMALYKLLQWLFVTFIKPDKDRDDDIAGIKKDIAEIKQKLDRDYTMLADHDKSINDLACRVVQQETDSVELHKVLRIIVVAEQAVTKSLLEDGNNKEGLRHAQNELNEYLQSKI